MTVPAYTFDVCFADKAWGDAARAAAAATRFQDALAAHGFVSQVDSIPLPGGSTAYYVSLPGLATLKGIPFERLAIDAGCDLEYKLETEGGSNTIDRILVVGDARAPARRGHPEARINTVVSSWQGGGVSYTAAGFAALMPQRR